jgi:MFS family permease
MRDRHTERIDFPRAIGERTRLLHKLRANSCSLTASRPVPLQDRAPLYALYAANGISMLGNVLTALAIPWFVLQTTGSAEKTGLTGFFAMLPLALAAFVGGSIVDRLGFKRTSIVADLASGATVALIPLLFLTVGLDFTVLLALVFMTNLLDAPGSTAREAIVPELATRAGVSFERAGSLNQIVERSSRLLGAPLAGGMIAAFGATTVLWIDAVTFFVSAAIIALLVHATAQTAQTKTRRHWRAELFEGIRFIWRDKLILTIVLTVMITNFLDTGLLQTIYIQQVYDNAIALGLSVAASGGG